MRADTVTKHVRAPREEVFRVAADLARSPEIVGAIERVEMLTDGPVRVGTRWRETRRFGKRAATADLEVTGFDPPRSYSVGSRMLGFRFRSDFRFEEAGDGTDVAVTFEATPTTALARVFAFALKPMLTACVRSVAGDLDDLAAHVEAGAGARAG